MELSITDGNIVVRGNIAKREKSLRADYVLFMNEGRPLAVVEAKSDLYSVLAGLQQKADSQWREILEYFSPATQIGMTATPRETKYASNTHYFGEPVYFIASIRGSMTVSSLPSE